MGKKCYKGKKKFRVRLEFSLVRSSFNFPPFPFISFSNYILFLIVDYLFLTFMSMLWLAAQKLWGKHRSIQNNFILFLTLCVLQVGDSATPTSPSLGIGADADKVSFS